MDTHTSPASRSGFVKQALREPLLHFLLLGAVVFGIDHALALNRGDAQTITVGPAVREEAHGIFVAGRKREPTAQELQTLLDRWIDNEVLYREGLALGLDRGDTSIRERVIFKALSVAQAGISLPTIDEAGLKTWFEARRERYDTPDRFDFYEAVPHGTPSAESLKVFTAALNGKAQSEVDSSLRVFKDRPRDNLVQSYGSGFADGLAKLEPGRWELLPSSEGPRLVRLEALKPGAKADYAAIRETVYQNWKDDTLAQRTTQAIREMGRKYTVRNDGAAQ